MPMNTTSSIGLSGKTVLVTGGGVGIGREVALALGVAGAEIALTYHSHDGEAVADSLRSQGRRATAFRLDATVSSDVDQVVEKAAAALGGHIDILINNAGGLVGRKELSDMDDSHWYRVLNLNLSSIFFCTRATLRYMPDGGRIVSISSIAARNGGGPGAVAYASAKAGIHGFTRALAKELGPRRITVNAVAPGLILDTPFHATFTSDENQKVAIAATPLHRPGYPADCAGAVLYLVSDLGSFSTGAVVDVNGGTYFS
jgi:3-oxoacyl-[acyl-carrier protein] reductase